MYCTKCGHQNIEGTGFCSNCGNPLQTENPQQNSLQSSNMQPTYMQTQDPQSNKNKKKTKINILIFVTIAVLLVAIVIAAILFFNDKAKKDKYNDALSLGDKYLQELDYENAILAYEEAIHIDQKQPEPYLQLSTVYEKTEQYEEALDILDTGKENGAFDNVDSKIVDDRISEIETTKKEAEEVHQKPDTVDPEPDPEPVVTPEPEVTEQEQEASVPDITLDDLIGGYVNDEYLLELSYLDGSLFVSSGIIPGKEMFSYAYDEVQIDGSTIKATYEDYNGDIKRIDTFVLNDDGTLTVTFDGVNEIRSGSYERYSGEGSVFDAAFEGTYP